MDDHPRLHAETLAEWQDWLATNHATTAGVWLVSWRTGTGRPAPSYDDAVTEALRYGWIDSTARTIDEERSMLRFTPRRPGSGWARSNKERIARLEAEGRLEPAGAAILEAARADGSWTLFDSVEDMMVPDDLGASLDAVPGGREGWDALPPSARKAYLYWLVQAKRPETRQRRIIEVAERASRSERPGQ
jgi:uncharacterized protein YdeI (YjbR/CyaY-like superfamily)